MSLELAQFGSRSHRVEPPWAARDEGPDGTCAARSYALAQMADMLDDLGFEGLRGTGLRRKRAVALDKGWLREGGSFGTMTSRTAHLRSCAEGIGLPGVRTARSAWPTGEYVTKEDRSVGNPSHTRCGRRSVTEGRGVNCGDTRQNSVTYIEETTGHEGWADTIADQRGS